MVTSGRDLVLTTVPDDGNSEVILHAWRRQTGKVPWPKFQLRRLSGLPGPIYFSASSRAPILNSMKLVAGVLCLAAASLLLARPVGSWT